MKRTPVSLALFCTLLLLGAGCASEDPGAGSGGSGTSEAPNASEPGRDLGTSLECDEEPTPDELLAYEVPEANEDYDVTVMQVSSAGYYYQAIEDGAREAADAAGVELTHLSAEGYASPDVQLRQIEDALQRGTDALVMAPSDISGSVPVVEKALEAGIPVVNISSEVDHPDVHMVMQDDYTFGQLSADRVAEVLGEEGGTGIIIAGPANATWSQRRTEGFQDRVEEEYPEIEIAAAPTQLVDPAEGLRSFEDAVQATPEIDWIYAVHYFILQPNSIPEEYRGEVPYVAAGYEPDSIAALEDGTLDSVFGIAPRWMGLLGVGRAVELLNGEEPPRVTCTPIPLFTSEDIGTPFADAELIEQ